jgi:hypothetical protein
LSTTEETFFAYTLSFFPQWFKNDAPLLQERNRVTVKTKLKGEATQWSTIKFSSLETLVCKKLRCF